MPASPLTNELSIPYSMIMSCYCDTVAPRIIEGGGKCGACEELDLRASMPVHIRKLYEELETTNDMRERASILLALAVSEA